jgi:hypothetical protein
MGIAIRALEEEERPREVRGSAFRYQRFRSKSRRSSRRLLPECGRVGLGLHLRPFKLGDPKQVRGRRVVPQEPVARGHLPCNLSRTLRGIGRYRSGTRRGGGGEADWRRRLLLYPQHLLRLRGRRMEAPLFRGGDRTIHARRTLRGVCCLPLIGLPGNEDEEAADEDALAVKSVARGRYETIGRGNLATAYPCCHHLYNLRHPVLRTITIPTPI